LFNFGDIYTCDTCSKSSKCKLYDDITKLISSNDTNCDISFATGADCNIPNFIE